MNPSISTESPTLVDLHELTLDLFRDERRITRALDWVDQVLPLFPSACRNAVLARSTTSLDRWSEWIESDEAGLISEAGKGDIFEWRLHWLRQLIDVTRAICERGCGKQQKKGQEEKN